MLDRKPQPARPARSNHQPVRALRKRIVRQRLAEIRVVDSEVLVCDSRFRHTRAAASLENEDRFVRVRLRHPAPHRSAAQPFVFEGTEAIEVVVPGDVLPRIERQRLRAIEPERTTSGRVEMPSNDVPHVSVEPLARRSYVGSDRGCSDHRGILAASWGRLKAVATEVAEGTEFTNGETEKTEAKRRRLQPNRAPACGLARRPKAGDWVERGAVGASRWSFLSAWARRSPLHPGRATARREPSQGMRVRRICQLHPLDSSQQIRSVRPNVVKLPAVCAAQHLHTSQACLLILGE